MSDEITNIWARCPLCGSPLDGQVWYVGTAKCRLGHYEYHGMGSYASQADIILDGKKESFAFDDMFGDEDKFDARVKEIRAARKFDDELKALRQASKPKSKLAENREAKLRAEFKKFVKDHNEVYHDRMAAFMDWAIKKLAERQEPPSSSIEEALKRCDEWRLTDEQVEELLK